MKGGRWEKEIQLEPEVSPLSKNSNYFLDEQTIAFSFSEVKEQFD